MRLTITKGMRQYPTDQSVNEASKAWLEAMERVAATEIRRYSPVDTGGIVQHLSSTNGGLATGRGIKVSMGPLVPLRLNRTAPKSTIKRFLQWYRYARLNEKKPKGQASGSWPTAWYYLKEQERSALRAARYGSRFGGPHPPPTYTEAVNAGKVPLPAGTPAYAKAMRNKGFIERIRKDVEYRRVIAAHAVLNRVRP